MPLRPTLNASPTTSDTNNPTRLLPALPFHRPLASLCVYYCAYSGVLLLTSDGPCVRVTDISVAARGKDASRDEHNEVVRHGVEQDYLPTVDVFLPVCNEPIDLIANTWKHVSALDYPNFTVHVLDDGASSSVRDLADVFEFQCEW